MKRSRLLNTKLVENINVPKLPDVIMLDTHEDISKIFFEEGDLLDAKSIADRLATVVNVSETVGKTLWDMKNTYDTKMREMEETVKDAAEIAEDAQDYIDSQISDVKRNITGLDDALEGINQTLIGVDININNIEGAIIDINSNLNNYATIASLNQHIQELTETDEELREEIEKLKNSSTGPGGNITLADYVKIEDYNEAIGDINLRIDGVNDRIISIEEQISTFPSTYATREWVADKISELGVIQPGEGTKFAIRYQGGTQYAPTINDRGYKTVTNSQVLAETYGWTVTEPASYEHLWAIEATFNLDGTLVGTWSDPIRRTGIQGPIGITPNAFFVSTVFLRSETRPNKPVGGSYDKPVPDGWWDGVPSGDEILWASSRTFSSDGEDPEDKEWSTPAQMTDTANFNVEFSELEVYVKPGDRNGHTEESWHEVNSTWSNTANEKTIWMATCTYSNGKWEPWQVSKIKGEDGKDGTSIDIKKGAKIVPAEADLESLTAVEGDVCFVGSITDMENVKLWIYKSGEWVLKTDNVTGDAYLVGEYIFVYDGDSWVKSAFKGDPGLPAFIHIKYANSTTEGDWTGRGNLAIENPIRDGYEATWGEVPGAYIGIASDNNPDDPLYWKDYTWTKWQGEDGFGYEYIYKATPDYSAPLCPKSENIGDDEVPDEWFDDPVTVTSTEPYCWVCYRKKVKGVWRDYKGSNTNPLYAALYTRFPVEVLEMNTSFKSFVFTRTNEEPDIPYSTTPEDTTYNTYSNPIPWNTVTITNEDGTTSDELMWSDGIPTGEEILWCSTRIFSSDKKYPQQDSWTKPKQMTDTADFDVEFSDKEAPGDPSGHPNTNGNWSNESSESTIWMATSTYKNGEWTEWQVSKIKGEKGNDGTSINIKQSAILLQEGTKFPTADAVKGNAYFVGDVTDMDPMVLYIVDKETDEWVNTSENPSLISSNDTYLISANDTTWLFIWDGDSWVKSQFKGDPGTPAYIHIKYANSNTPGDWTNRGEGVAANVNIPSGDEGTGWGEVAGPWLGIWSDNTVDDPTYWYTYRWTRCEGQDGFGYEYIYCRTSEYDAPDIPPTTDETVNGKTFQDDGFVPTDWYDDPVDVDSFEQYCWMCYRQKVDGKWGDFRGSALNDGCAALWAKWGADGNGILRIDKWYLVSNITELTNDIRNGNWESNSPPVTEDAPYLWEKAVITYENGAEGDPDYRIIGRIGQKGIDGTTIEYIYILMKADETPTNMVPEKGSDSINSNEPSDDTERRWTDDPQTVTKDFPYQWISERTRSYNESTGEYEWSAYSTPARWNNWSEDSTTCVLDFDNDFDDITYNEFGAVKYENSAVTSTARLYKNGVITPYGPSYEGSSYYVTDSAPNNYGDVEYDITGGALKVTVSGIPEGASSRNITVGVTLDGINYYYDTFTVRRLVNEDGYKLVCTPNSIVENISDGRGSHNIQVKVYKKGNGGLTEVSSLPYNYQIYVAEGTNSFDKTKIVTDGTYVFNSSSGANVVKFILSNDTQNWSFLDYVDIPVAYVENGDSTTTVEKNPIIYPAGKWDPEKNYIMSENAAGIATTPYVLHEKIKEDGEVERYYWVLIASESDFAEPVEGSSVWEKFEMYEAVYSDIGVFKQALVGQAVFYGDYMYSQEGILSKKVKDVTEDDSFEINQYSEKSDMYELFDPNDPHAADIQYIEEDFRFSTILGQPTNPNLDLTGWYETIDKDPTWVAYRTKQYGTTTWSNWAVKGFIQWDEPVGGILSDESQLPSSGSKDYGYIIGENLYMWNGTAWVNVGDFEIALVDNNLSKNSKFTPNTYINLKTGEIYSRKSKFDDAELDNAECTRLSVIDGFQLYHQKYGYDEYASAIGSSEQYNVLPNLDQISNKLLVINSRSDWDETLSVSNALNIKLPKPAKDNGGALRYLYQTKYIGNKVCIVNNTHQYIRNEMLKIYNDGGSLADHAEEYTRMDIIKIFNVQYEEFISSDPSVQPPNYNSAVILMPGQCLMAELKMKYIPNEISITDIENDHTYGLSRYNVLNYHVYESTTDPLYRGQATPYFYWAFTIFDLSDRTTLEDGNEQEYFNALAFSNNIINYG